ncbi:hypothetical protein BOTBODRAFT_587442 [Botryobasidium botryosum FD-172 SS1]|uniref:Uncharacterized protein n=1 Tax=Botryobasidium botryosum (strain FD-172 SS1) TaxID=930990 RepID=A0A067M7Y6_BOTB1|nr:hypothetical protein BOTBODRAFT_587442 [Botryobasidium botryosum FD-172 SS1]
MSTGFGERRTPNVSEHSTTAQPLVTSLQGLAALEAVRPALGSQSHESSVLNPSAEWVQDCRCSTRTNAGDQK